jgi:lipoteichoic acid synthase
MSKNRNFIYAFSMVGIFTALSFYRAGLIDKIYADTNRCFGCLNVPAMLSDFWLLCILMVLLAVSLWCARRWVAVMAGLVSVLVVLPFVIDIWLTRILSTRLRWDDFIQYAPNIADNFSVVLPVLKTFSGALLAIACFFLLWLAVKAHFIAKPDRKASVVVVAAVAVIMFALWLSPTLFYVGQPHVNVFAFHDMRRGMVKEYTEQFIAKQSAMVLPEVKCEKFSATKPSVIVLVLESWSSYHSRLFSGLNNETPRLDEWARRGSYFPDFIANGFSTEGGLIAVMTGYAPIPTAGNRTGASAFRDVKGDFYRRIADEGYRSYFLTSGSLNFVKRAQWLSWIGVQQAEGGTNSAYDGLPRGAFNAAEDIYLFDRAREWHKTEGVKSPFVATILSVGTHPPFVDPKNGEMNEFKRFNEMDTAAGNFIDYLESAGFFANGVLVVTGDHRAMVPVSAKERELFGDIVLAKVPAFVLGQSGLPPGKIPGNYQHTDLIPSLNAMLLGEACRNKIQGLMLGANPKPAKYAVYWNSVQWNSLQVLSNTQAFGLSLNGDQTAWSGSKPSDANELLALINKERIARMVGKPLTDKP